MLAGAEEALCAAQRPEVKTQMRVIDCVVAGLIDYAGLYPPAGLGMDAAVRNYLRYARGEDAAALGRFVVSVNRVDELCEAAGEQVQAMRLSVLASTDADCAELARMVSAGLPVDAVEFKASTPEDMKQLCTGVPAGVTAYCEVPVRGESAAALDAMAAAGMRAKLRMGGLVAEAIPGTQDVAEMLQALAMRRLAFKATAGLHHAVRGRYALTYEADSTKGRMHGFMNLMCAAALVYFGGDAVEARRVLEEVDASAWRVAPDAIAWRGARWSAEQMRAVREEFFAGFGSCSFEEPVGELEALGWL